MMAAMIVVGLIPVAFLLRNTSPFAHFTDALGQLPALGRNTVTEKSFIKQIVAWRWIAFGGAGLALIAFSRRMPVHATVAAVIALVAADLLTLDAGFNPQIPLSQASAPTPPALGYLQSHVGHQRMSGSLTPTAVDLQANLAEQVCAARRRLLQLPEDVALGRPVGRRTASRPEIRTTSIRKPRKHMPCWMRSPSATCYRRRAPAGRRG